MVKELTLILTPDDAQEIDALKAAAAKKLGAPLDGIIIRKRSIDSRRRDIKISISLSAYIGETPPSIYSRREFPDVSKSRMQAIVAGFGPAGIFASLTLLEQGIKPIVLERGKNVHERLKDTGRLSQEGILDTESNYAFGEGGAGAFSDGKLYTRSSKRGDVRRILELLVQHGAAESILIDAHPHIGSDKLPYIIERIRNTIIEHGGEVLFGKRVESLISRNDETIGVRCSDGSEYMGPVILATGHSAKDVYSFLSSSGFALEAKDTAVGVRLECSQSAIDRMQYHGRRYGTLPAASYSFVTQANGRGVYSFCMCPGGVIVPTSTEEGLLSVNGMSPSGRNGRWANSGIIVELRKDDIAVTDPFSMLRAVEAIERRAWNPGFAAPSIRLLDFVKGREPSSLPPTSYPRPILPKRMEEILPDIVSSSLREGLLAFDRMARGGFFSPDAILIAPETRTSSPVRILRDAAMKQGRGFYPAGEGAGYAGGIVSAALDGTNAALSLGGDYGHQRQGS